MSRSASIVIPILIFAVLVILGIQIWGNIQISHHISSILDEVNPPDQAQIGSEKERQEIIALRIENETKSLFWTGMIGSIGTFITVLVAFFGIWQGLREYWKTKDKERLDRAASDLNKIWEGLANTDIRARAGAVVGLQHYLTPDMCEYHARVLSALMVASRVEDKPEITHLITLTIQLGLKNVDGDIARNISWQRVKLPGIDLHGEDKLNRRDLREYDFRDANLENADLSYCDLKGALLNAANLKGAKLDFSILKDANLEYADLAGASFINADFTGCNLMNAGVLNADLNKADINTAIFDPEEIDWKLIKNWRDSLMNPELKNVLVDRYGPEEKGPGVLLLLWEYPPLIAGGAWTASYHIIRNLRKLGTSLTVMVPWDRSVLDLNLFGNEIALHPMGIIPPLESAPQDGNKARLPYGVPSSVYGKYSQVKKPGFSLRKFSAYNVTPANMPSPYGVQGLSSYGMPYSVYGRYTRDLRSGFVYDRYASVYGKIQRLEKEPVGGIVKQFQQLVSRYIRRMQLPFDLIYASDWPTFWAAEELSRLYNKPWIAHFHSTENDRRRHDNDEVIVAIERRAAANAARIVTPSRLTASEVGKLYNVDVSKIKIIPNPLSGDDMPVSDVGSFDTGRVIFLGRLTWQKGPDIFVEICRRLHERLPSVSFTMYGDGEESSNIDRQIALHNLDIQRSGFVDWESRGSVFGGASVLLVTSRAEPFGMVILEAMERGTAVLYPEHAGASEVLSSGIRIGLDDIDAAVEQLYRLLADRNYWKNIVEAQYEEIGEYRSRNYEKQLLALFSEITGLP